MATKQLAQTRLILLACAVILSMISASCQPAPAPAQSSKIKPATPTPVPTAAAVPRLPISASEVQAIAAPFDKLSKAYIQAWNTHDIENMRPLLTDDVLYYESDNKPMESTAVGLLGMNWQVLHDDPNFEGRQAGIFINRDSAFDIWAMWNYDEAVRPSSAEDPIRGYDWYTLRDGKIASMWLFWDVEYLNAAFGGTPINVKPMQDYEKAWSSGDPKAVAALYAPQVVRHDMLFGPDQNGPAAIQGFAADFFSWYPGVRLELLESFQLGNSFPRRTGGVYVIHAIDQAGKPCDIRAIVQLEWPVLDDMSAGKIMNEWMFYQPDSLIACGWAR